MGGKWMVLIRHWNLFVYGRWHMRDAGGRWHLGGHPGLKHNCRQRKRRRQQVSDKREVVWHETQPGKLCTQEDVFYLFLWESLSFLNRKLLLLSWYRNSLLLENINCTIVKPLRNSLKDLKMNNGRKKTRGNIKVSYSQLRFSTFKKTNSWSCWNYLKFLWLVFLYFWRINPESYNSSLEGENLTFVWLNNPDTKSAYHLKNIQPYVVIILQLSGVSSVIVKVRDLGMRLRPNDKGWLHWLTACGAAK